MMGEISSLDCSAGANLSKVNHLGETSMQHMYRKTAIIRSIIQAMKPFRSDTILLVVANPVDLLTSIAQKLSGLPACQVLGSGTCLDSVRLRGLLAGKLGVRARSSYVVTYVSECWLNHL